MRICPHCDTPIIPQTDGPNVLASILHMRSVREVYACQGGGYAISYQGGEVSKKAIDEALKQGLIKPKYPDKDLEVWVLA